MVEPDPSGGQQVVTDLLVVGAGPAGLYAAYYAGFRGMSVTVLDSLPEPGGQVTALYPEKLIYDVAGFPSIKGQDLVDALVAQASAYQPRYLLGHRAEQLVDGEQEVEVRTHRGVVVRAKAVLVTGGIGTFTPRPLPAVAGSPVPGVVYFVPHLQEMAGLDVLVVGGGDSAVDWALSLESLAAS
ncbi:MAG: NAD(P)/FAD-dependent oxidoreductase, partial [Actinomycetes bacterium]